MGTISARAPYPRSSTRKGYRRVDIFFKKTPRRSGVDEIREARMKKIYWFDSVKLLVGSSGSYFTTISRRLGSKLISPFPE